MASPYQAEKKLIGYQANALVRTFDHHWVILTAWGFTTKGARRRLDRKVAEVIVGEVCDL